ncbi:MAG: prepilin-type N-terminal cleavage/methylation domain-containing protein [Candidatus Sungbacteria bacterium]|uniref:Prepilin-type N-terminal cleavage/methylation domain-containing protein n=1 Tax=Candidatus Sungiibacteriota bacterium TaxID=2750080 RepID=A0A932DSB4_9BACT|nr:prepilin-type N-terminal cleavage/methylation domain-containing protein [Candidatus Sungbacteria bacterium]
MKHKTLNIIKNKNQTLNGPQAPCSMFHDSGFTLVELIVAVAIFAAVITIASSIFVSSIGSQRENINQQEVLDNARFVLEIMGRAIRQSTVLTCPDQASCTSNSISLNHPVKGAVTYQLTNGRISENGSTLISGGVLATRLDFTILGNGLSDNTQPRVVVVMSLKNFNPRADTQNFIDLQTTITPRNLQIQ